MRQITDKKEYSAVMQIMEQAYYEGLKSQCKKSQRGAIITQNGKILAAGHNRPTLPDICCLREGIKDQSRKELCSAQHAEMMALTEFLKNKYSGITKNTVMYHVKVGENGGVPSGEPSCPGCSIQMLSAGIEKMVLWQNKGLFEYEMEEFNRLSIEYHVNR